MDKAEVIEAEQAYFDAAMLELERSLADSDHSPEGAANAKAAADLLRKARARRAMVELDAAIADGRFDTEDGDTFYIGKQGVRTEDRDILVLDWRAEAAQPFYTASIADPCGVTRKRTFQAPHNRIVDFDDIVYDDLKRMWQALEAPRVEPSYDDALLKDLDRDRTGEMQDIVKTIQSAQFDLIRTPLDRLLIIQGGPGTGKTAIALHRVSWLLVNHKSELDATDVLVVGPSPTFSRYIRSLLPSLGDIDIVQQNLSTLGPTRSDRRSESADIRALKGDGRMAALLQRALEARVRLPEDEEGTFEITTRAGVVRIPNAGLIEALISTRSRWSYAQGRNRMRTYLSESLAAVTPGTLGASAQQIDDALGRLWPSLTAASFVRELLGSRDRLFEAAGAEFSAQEAGLLYRQSADRVSEETWSDADVALLDEADFLISGETSRFLHVVVDEAQDLSPMQMRSLRRRSNGSMTVVGDLAQSTGPFARSSWDDVATSLEQAYAPEQRELEYGYRVPRQVMDLASQLLPLIAPGVEPPRVVRDAPADPVLIMADEGEHAELAVRAAREYAGRGLSVGVVCPNQTRHLLVEAFESQQVKWHDSNNGALGQGLNLVSAVDAKGLEFDAVVVVSPHVIVEEDSNGHRLLYIALTRTTRFLTVIHDGDPLAMTRTSLDHARDLDDTPARPETPIPLPSGGSSAPATVPVDGEPVVDGVEPPRNASGVRSAVVEAVAENLAAEIRESVAAAMWPQVIDELRRRLGVTGEELPDRLE